MCLAPSRTKGQADHTGPGLAVETSAFVLLVEAQLWEIYALGVHAMAALAPFGRGHVASDSIPAARRPPDRSTPLSSRASPVLRPRSVPL